jgi:beta-ribofuranosylaminobenzene 5'-phosphate synthase
MYRVHAPSRLHFGLLTGPGGRPDASGRRFGGAGLMIREPGVQLTVRAAATWKSDGPLAERALAFAQQFTRSFRDPDAHAFHIHVEKCAPEHAGLGTGTQLGLAVARGVALATGRPHTDAAALAERIGRGQRSALGSHGFDRGGFLVDGGKGPHTAIAPLIARVDFPEDWKIVLVVPEGEQGLHGVSETQAFEEASAAPENSDRLCRLLLLGMLPALAEHDLPAFGEALYEFNRRAGEMFRPLQGGTYAGAKVAAVVDFVRRNGVAAAGQSSWGPAIFAIVDGDRAPWLVALLHQHFHFNERALFITQADNRGAWSEPTS